MHRQKRKADSIAITLLLTGLLVMLLSLTSGVIAQDSKRISDLEKENISSADKIAVLQKAVDAYERLQLDNRLIKLELQNDFILKIGYATIGTLLFLACERIWQVAVSPRGRKEQEPDK